MRISNDPVPLLTTLPITKQDEGDSNGSKSPDLKYYAIQNSYNVAVVKNDVVVSKDICENGDGFEFIPILLNGL